VYVVRYRRDLRLLRERVERAVARQSALTLTYRELAKDPVTGKRIVSRIPEHQEYDIVVRTVEPYAIDMNKDGDLYMRTLDRISRDEPAFRSYRLDRVLLYTVHRPGTFVLDHEIREDSLVSQ
jgi:hypothetical protein